MVNTGVSAEATGSRKSRSRIATGSGHSHTSSTSSCPPRPTLNTSTMTHHRRFSFQSSSASSTSSSACSDSSSSSSVSRGQSPSSQQHIRLNHHHQYVTPHTRSHSAAAAMAGPSPSFFRRIFKAFVGTGGVDQHGCVSRQSRVHLLDGSVIDVSAIRATLFDEPLGPDVAQDGDGDGDGSYNDSECNGSGGHLHDTNDATDPGAFSQRQESNVASRHKNRNNSFASTSLVANVIGQGGVRNCHPGHAPNVSGSNVHSNYPSNALSDRVHDNNGGISSRRSSVISGIAGESIQYDPRLSADKHRTFTANNNQLYRQHFTGHGAMSTVNAANSIQQGVIKRRMSLFKSVAAAGVGSTSRRGSAFSTKSQETAVNLTGINPADEFEGSEDYNDVEGKMDLDEEDEEDDEDDYDDYINFNEYHDENANNLAMDLDHEYYATHGSMLTADVELELYRRRQEATRLASRRLRHLRRLRRQSLLSDSNNLTFRSRTGGCSECLAPLLECARKPSPIHLPEILHLIFQFVVDLTPADDYSQREIYSCLLVSKQWYLVAQKTLWREIRFKNAAKLELFVDLLKRTETVECLGIERNHQPQASAALLGQSNTGLQQQEQQQHLLNQRRASIASCGEHSEFRDQEESIMSPTAMQKRLHERASAVKRIVLHKLKLIEDKDIMLLASWFRNLQILEFYICEKLTDKVVMAVAENCPQLQQLLMPGCAKITDAGISQIALLCPRMKHLDLRACSNVSDESLILVAKHCPDLWHLNVGRVSSATKVTGKSIVEIAKNTNLNTLGLAGCAMSDDAVIEIARYSRSGLHRISLNSCPLLTSASVRALMQLCPNLAVLEIKQCLLVTDMATLYRFSTRRVLVELCPELQRRLLEYKVGLSSMNASIQSNNIASTQATTTTTEMINDNNTNNSNNNDNNDNNPTGNDNYYDNPSAQQLPTTTATFQQ